MNCIPKNIFINLGNIQYGDRCSFLNQKGCVVWFTGLSGSGKTTISCEVESLLFKQEYLAYRLDGDNLRHGLCSDLGFSETDRDENIRRITEVAALFCDAGFITLVSAISPKRNMRTQARSYIGDHRFIEIFVKAELNTCIQRDPKGLYAKALSGEISDLTGISSIYEPPVDMNLILETDRISPVQCAEAVINLLRIMDFVD